MPTYEYACTSCHHEWEAEQSIKEDALTECPACHHASAKRQISRGGGFILKGGGWYSDLYSSASNTKPPPSIDTTKGSDGDSSKSSDAGSAKTTDAGSTKGPGSAGSSSSGSAGSASGSSGSAPAGGSGSSAKSPAAAS
jgi:putative FmdB family regulatory protein